MRLSVRLHSFSSLSMALILDFVTPALLLIMSVLCGVSNAKASILSSMSWSVAFCLTFSCIKFPRAVLKSSRFCGRQPLKLTLHSFIVSGGFEKRDRKSLWSVRG